MPQLEVWGGRLHTLANSQESSFVLSDAIEAGHSAPALAAMLFLRGWPHRAKASASGQQSMDPKMP